MKVIPNMKKFLIVLLVCLSCLLSVWLCTQGMDREIYNQPSSMKNMGEFAQEYYASGIERPPIPYRAGPFVASYRYVLDPHAVCSMYMRVPGPEWRIHACYLTRYRIIILPYDDGSQLFKDLKEHEEAHARGWKHAPMQ